MPAKNRVKTYLSNSYYHIYNRGIDKRDIFVDHQDYRSFIDLLKRYLSNAPEEIKPGYKRDKPSVRLHRQKMSLGGVVKIVAYCLMPNHFHILLWQETPDGITKLMRRVCTNYSMYFNKKYKRHGPLFENIYRGIRVDSSSQVAELSKFIHLNPVVKSVRRFGLVETVTGSRPSEYPYSSYHQYLTRTFEDWLDPEPIFKLVNEKYQDFMERETTEYSSEIGSLALDLNS